MIDAATDSGSGTTDPRIGEPQSVVDQIAEAILGLILTNDLEPGQPVAIQELSKQLGVSHVPVREALRRLEGRGLVQFRRGRRPQIAPIHYTDFENIYHLRVVVERDVSCRSADLMTPGIVSQLADTLNDFERILTRGSAIDSYSAHSRFHTLMLPGATDWDLRLLEELWTGSERYIQLYTGVLPGNDAARTIVTAHASLLAAAQTGDSQRITDAVVQHIIDSKTFISGSVRAASGTARRSS